MIYWIQFMVRLPFFITAILITAIVFFIFAMVEFFLNTFQLGGNKNKFAPESNAAYKELVQAMVMWQNGEDHTDDGAF